MSLTIKFKKQKYITSFYVSKKYLFVKIYICCNRNINCYSSQRDEYIYSLIKNITSQQTFIVIVFIRIDKKIDNAIFIYKTNVNKQRKSLFKRIKYNRVTFVNISFHVTYYILNKIIDQ